MNYFGFHISLILESLNYRAKLIVVIFTFI